MRWRAGAESDGPGSGLFCICEFKFCLAADSNNKSSSSNNCNKKGNATGKRIKNGCQKSKKLQQYTMNGKPVLLPVKEVYSNKEEMRENNLKKNESLLLQDISQSSFKRQYSLRC